MIGNDAVIQYKNGSRLCIVPNGVTGNMGIHFDNAGNVTVNGPLYVQIPIYLQSTYTSVPGTGVLVILFLLMLLMLQQWNCRCNLKYCCYARRLEYYWKYILFCFKWNS